MIENNRFRNLVENHFERMIERNPVMSSYLGLHEYDAELGNFTIQRYMDDIHYTKKLIENLKTDINRNKLNIKNQIEYDIFIYVLERDLFNIEILASWKKGFNAISYISTSIYPLFSRDYAPLEERIESIICRLTHVDRFLEDTKSLWIEPVKLWAELTIESASFTNQFMYIIVKSVEGNIKNEQFEQLSSIVNHVSVSIDSYASWVEEEQLPRAKTDWSIGEVNFKHLLKLRHLDITPEELTELGINYLVETRQKMNQLAYEIDPSKTLEEILELVYSYYPKDFESVLNEAAKMCIKARDFIKEHDLLTLHDDEKLDVISTPHHLIPLFPFGGYSGPERFSEDKTGHYFVTPVTEESALKKRHNYASLKNIAIHEGYPGHHIQITSAMRNPSLVRLFSYSYAEEFIEGWAHYCEDLMTEYGFNDKKVELIQLEDILWRAARIIIDVEMCSGRMTFDEAVEKLVEETGMEKNAAIAEIKRYTLTPTYQLSYLYGKHLLLELKKEIKEKMGKKYSDKFFHDIILKEGSIPIYFLRKIFEEKIKK